MACDGATGADDFTSTGVFAAAGKTGLVSTGADGAGSFCIGVLAGAIGTCAGVTGAGSCGICGWGGSGFFSRIGNDDMGAGGLTGVGKATRGTGTGVSPTVGEAGPDRPFTGSPANGGAGPHCRG